MAQLWMITASIVESSCVGLFTDLVRAAIAGKGR